MFSGCPSVRTSVPSVRTSVRPVLVIALSEEPIDGIPCQTLVMYVSCRANELIRFLGSIGQRSQAHYVCKNSS